MVVPKKREPEHRATAQAGAKRFAAGGGGGGGAGGKAAGGSAKPAYKKPAFGSGAAAGGKPYQKPAYGAAAAGGKPAFKKPAYAASGDKPAFKKPAYGAAAAGGKPAFKKPAYGAAAAGGKPAYPKPAYDKAGAGGKPALKPSADGKKAPAGSINGAATRREQRDAKREMKAGQRKNFATIQEAVVLWEQLRPASVTPEEKKKLAEQIMGKAKGKLVELANHHSASRVIQYVAKHGGPEVQAAVKAEVKDNVVALSKSKYGHFIVIKLIDICSKAEVPGLVKLFKGHVAELLRHPQGADVLTDLYDVASAAERNAMCAEFYGREFALFDGVHQQAGTVAHLREVLAAATPVRRAAILQQLTKYLMPIMEKAILHPPMTHRLLREFLECAPGGTVEDAVDTLTQTGAALLKMVHTHDGATVVCMLLAYGNAKDRKRLIKAMKGHVVTMATNEWAYTVLATALSVVDDTSMMAKVIVAEIKADLGSLVDNASAHRVMLQLLSPDNRQHVPQCALSMVHPPRRMARGLKAPSSAGPDDDEEEAEEGAPASKKQKGSKPQAAAAAPVAADEDAEVPGPGEQEERELGISKKDVTARRKELLGAGKAGLGEALTALCAKRAGELLRSVHGAAVVVEVARGGEGGLLHELCPAGVASVQSALLAEASVAEDHVDEAPEAAGDGDAEEGAAAGPSGRSEHIMLNYWGSRALRRLVLHSVGTGPGVEPAQLFATQLWEQAVKGQCSRWVDTHAAKVLAALAGCGVPQVVKEASAELAGVLPVPLAEWRQRFGAHDAAAGAKAAGGAAKAGKKAAGGAKAGKVAAAAAAAPTDAAAEAPAAAPRGKKAQAAAAKAAAPAVAAKRREPAGPKLAAVFAEEKPAVPEAAAAATPAKKAAVKRRKA